METRALKTEYQTDGRSLFGYAAIWDAPSSLISERGKSFTEIIRRGAFSRSLKESSDVLCCYNHDPASFLGRTSSKTLRISEDNIGLKFEVDLPDTATGNEVKELTKRGDLSGCSFAFKVKTDRWTGSIRELIDVNLYELGPVLTPAYPDTVLGLRNLSHYKAKLMLMKRK